MRTLAKARKLFFLSKESVRYLESVRSRTRARSLSIVVEDLIRQCRDAEEIGHSCGAIAGYYDSLPNHQSDDDHAWGKFSESQFAARMGCAR